MSMINASYVKFNSPAEKKAFQLGHCYAELCENDCKIKRAKEKE